MDERSSLVLLLACCFWDRKWRAVGSDQVAGLCPPSFPLLLHMRHIHGLCVGADPSRTERRADHNTKLEKTASYERAESARLCPTEPFSDHECKMKSVSQRLRL